jgi:hypothetical protein
MQFAIELMHQIPAGWPRLATLAAIVLAYCCFPSLLRQLVGRQQEKETLERLMRLLQVKKLLLELAALQQEKHLAGYAFPSEARLLAALQDSATAVATAPGPLPYVRRLAYSLLGGAAFLLCTTLLFVCSPSHATTPWATATFLLRDAGLAAGCGLLASLLPWGTPRASVLSGVTMPLALALLVVTLSR